MKRPGNSTIFFRPLRDVFRSYLQPKRPRPRLTIECIVARLCVLYEDLRIETFACAAESLPRLDVLDPVEEGDGSPMAVGRYRRNYFLRRSIATIKELIDSLEQLERNSEFVRIRNDFDAEVRALWDESFGYLDGQKAFMNKLRDDVGGHFGEQAAAYSVSHFSPDAIGRLEFRMDDQRHRTEPRLLFAGEIAATAMLRHLPGGGPPVEIQRMIKNCAECYRHATSCVHAVIATILVPRFRE